jgi:flagellar L-ring protein precursor FlgH
MTIPASRGPVAKLTRFAALALLGGSLAACNVLNRVGDIGSAPQLNPIENPITAPSYRSVSMPMPEPERPIHMANSLWRPGARAFFKDQRAAKVGDILTVAVSIEDEAEIDNSTTRTRTNTEDDDVTGLLGYQSSLNRILPEALTSGTDLLNLSSSSAQTGEGTVERSETITFQIAAVVTQVLPNGNLVIWGHQEIRVNFEVRELLVAGVVRPEDISSANMVASNQIAEARISYGGRGQLTDVQQPRYGQQVLDIILPF